MLGEMKNLGAVIWFGDNTGSWDDVEFGDVTECGDNAAFRGRC